MALTGIAHKALIIGPAWVGDMVMAHCLVQRLTALSEHVEIHVAAPKATADDVVEPPAEQEPTEAPADDETVQEQALAYTAASRSRYQQTELF